jgi:hypothetical protein
MSDEEHTLITPEMESMLLDEGTEASSTSATDTEREYMHFLEAMKSTEGVFKSAIGKMKEWNQSTCHVKAFFNAFCKYFTK